MAIRWEMQMDSSELLLLGLLALAAISVAVVVYIIVVPYLSGERQMGKRIQGVTDNKTAVYTPPPVQAPPPINLKFFGFANEPGEPKKIFLSQGDDVFIAAEGDIVNRRYKVMRISANSVEIQDVLGSGPPQNIPLTQG